MDPGTNPGIVLGVHSLCFEWKLGRDNVGVVKRCRKLGATGFEACIFNPRGFPARLYGRAARDSGMTLAIGCGMPRWADAGSADPKKRQDALDFLKALADKGVECGAMGAFGAIAFPWGKLGLRSEDEWKRSVEVMQKAAEYVASLNHPFVLGVENINRYEYKYCNTVKEVLAYLEAVNRPDVVVAHMDWLHLHNEEKNPVAAMRQAVESGRVRHVHANESDRGQIGTGQVPAKEHLTVLRDGGYRGMVVIEAFRSDIEKLALATRTWRSPGDPDEVVRGSLEFLRRTCEEIGLPVAA